MEILFKSAEISYYLHATEDYNRVIPLIARALSVPPERFSITNVEGHYGNPIMILKTHLISKDAVNFAVSFFRKLPQVQKTTLLEDINRCLNEHGDLFVRLDKQELISGRLILGEVDPIRIKIKLPYNAPRTAIIEVCESLLKG